MKLTTARIAGLLYLGMAITGAIGYMMIFQSLYFPGVADEQTKQLIENEGLARIGLAMEFGIVLFQALTALWFYKLFQKKDAFMAGLVAVFGMVNAIVILIASATWLGALNAALLGNSAQTQLLFDLHDNLWSVGALFFGLWLIPLGILVKKSNMPEILSWLLVIGGLGYVISAFTTVLLPTNPGTTELLVIPASIGEVWMIGFLLFKPEKI